MTDTRITVLGPGDEIFASTQENIDTDYGFVIGVAQVLAGLADDAFPAGTVAVARTVTAIEDKALDVLAGRDDQDQAVLLRWRPPSGNRPGVFVDGDGRPLWNPDEDPNVDCTSCGHAYYRHFDDDFYGDNATVASVGCKYCPCPEPLVAR